MVLKWDAFICFVHVFSDPMKIECQNIISYFKFMISYNVKGQQAQSPTKYFPSMHDLALLQFDQ